MAYFNIIYPKLSVHAVPINDKNYRKAKTMLYFQLLTL